jgi:hypothetical protein
MTDQRQENHLDDIIKFACDAIEHYQQEIADGIEMGVITDERFLQGGQYAKLVGEILNSYEEWKLMTHREEDKQKGDILAPQKIVPRW